MEETGAQSTVEEGPGDLRVGAAARTLVSRLFREGAEAHPGVALSETDFTREVSARAAAGDEGEPETPHARLLRMARLSGGPDLYLAIACEHGAPGAWERLSGIYVQRLARALTAQGVPAAEADGIAADVPGDLFAAPREPRARTRIGLYRGLSSLFSFLTVAALRRWTNRQRGTAPASLDVAMEPVTGRAPVRDALSPLDRLVGGEESARADEAFGRAWSNLTAREALALLWKHRNGLPQSSIARLLGVGEPRVSRIVARGVERLKAGLEPLFGGTSPLSALERDAIRAAIERRLATLDIGPPPRGGPDSAPPRTADAS